MILFAGLVAVPGISLRVLQEVTGYHLPPVAAALIFGLSILGAAFVISWTAEAAEKDIPQALALAVLALIAVLPEYAVDIYFAWQAPHIEEYRHYAVANMTGANRLLIGLGWPLVFFVYFFKFRMPKLEVDRGHALDVLVLAIASIYSMSIVLKGSLALVDTFFLFALFGGYIFLAGRRADGGAGSLRPGGGHRRLIKEASENRAHSAVCLRSHSHLFRGRAFRRGPAGYRPRVRDRLLHPGTVACAPGIGSAGAYHCLPLRAQRPSRRGYGRAHRFSGESVDVVGGLCAAGLQHLRRQLRTHDL